MPDLDALLLPVCLAVGTAPLALAAWRRSPRRVGIAALGLWGLSAVALGVRGAEYSASRPDRAPVLDRPIEVLADGYLSSRACQSCHPAEYASWHASFHRTMTQVATRETMLAPWPKDGPRRFQYDERVFLIEQRGDEYWVELDDPDWQGEYGVPPRVWRQVVQITGAHHWQFYWFASGKTRKVQLFPLAYRVVDEPRWMPLDGCCVTPPTNRQQTDVARWSISCNKCHATHGRPRMRTHDEIDTHVVELGIACEACHGPGGEHVAANQDPLRRYGLHFSGAADPTIVNPTHLDHRRASMVCGNCHGVTRFRSDADREDWGENGYRYRPGDDVSDTRAFDTEGQDKFWADGMIRVSGREFNGLMRSPCYLRGEMSCMSCHRMHRAVDDPRPLAEWTDDQLHPDMRGNAACTQCHAEYLDDAYLVAHTHHPADSSGSNCYDCHMPHTTYGLLKGIRSHEVDSPDVAASIATGRPNGCNQCHLDRSLAWTAEHLERWYGIPVPEMDQDQREFAATVLWALKGDAGMRALAAWSMGWEEARAVSGTEWLTPLLAILLQDPYHAVRYIAQRSLGQQRGFEEVLGRYDFASGIPERQAGSQAIYQAWLRRAARNPMPERPELLIGPDGLFREAVMLRLLSEQDTTPLTLNE
jgi:hypothetical protein